MLRELAQLLILWCCKCTVKNRLAVSIGGKLGARVMSCRDTIHLICWYLEGRLSSVVETEIKRHLEGCSNCRLVLEAAVNTLDCYFNSERTEVTADAFRAA